MEKPAHEELRIEKIIKRKTDKLFLKSKRYGDSFNSSIDKKDLLKKICQYSPKPFRSLGRNSSVKVDFSNHATKTDVKSVSHLDTSSFALKTNLASINA